MNFSVLHHHRSRILLSSACILLAAFALTGCKDKNAPKVTVQKTETLAHGITLVTVEASASGKNLDDALQEALVLAVEQVNGARVAHTLDAHSVIADYSASRSRSAEGSAHLNASGSAEGNADASLQDADGKNTATGHVSGDYQADNTASAGYKSHSSEADHAALNTREEDKSASSSGIVHAFRILKQEQVDGVWQVRISAKIAKYNGSALSKRLKVAVLPFRKANGAATSGYENSVRDHLVSILSGAGKVAVLDRDYSQENAAEISQLHSEDFNKDEAVKLGQRLGADYILVGTVNAAVHTDSVYMQALGQRVYGDSHAKAKISYRLIEAATGAVVMSGMLNEAAAGNHLDALADTDARTISDRILNTLYPVQVVSISNGVFYLSRGGDSIHVGDQFRIMVQGQPLKDPDTGEVIGATETEVARIAVTEVEPKLSKAALVGQGAVPSLSGAKMIARPYEVAPQKPAAKPVTHKLAHHAHRAHTSQPVAGVDF